MGLLRSRSRDKTQILQRANATKQLPTPHLAFVSRKIRVGTDKQESYSRLGRVPTDPRGLCSWVFFDLIMPKKVIALIDGFNVYHALDRNPDFHSKAISRFTNGLTEPGKIALRSGFRHSTIRP